MTKVNFKLVYIAMAICFSFAGFNIIKGAIKTTLNEHIVLAVFSWITVILWVIAILSSFYLVHKSKTNAIEARKERFKRDIL